MRDLETQAIHNFCSNLNVSSFAEGEHWLAVCCSGRSSARGERGNGTTDLKGWSDPTAFGHPRALRQVSAMSASARKADRPLEPGLWELTLFLHVP
jgi:hypothetical protein